MQKTIGFDRAILQEEPTEWITLLRNRNIVSVNFYEEDHIFSGFPVKDQNAHLVHVASGDVRCAIKLQVNTRKL